MAETDRASERLLAAQGAPSNGGGSAAGIDAPMSEEERRAMLRTRAVLAMQAWVQAELEAGKHPMQLLGELQQALVGHLG